MADQKSRQGLYYAIGAYLIWGLIPLYFKLIVQVSPLEILAHRIAWSFVFMSLVIGLSGRRADFLAAVKSPRVLGTLAISTILIGTNWLTFIDAVFTKQVMQSSLGYFIGPLVTVLLGVFFFHERLRPLQIGALVLAAVGVLILVFNQGHIPWVALLLAVTFALYGMLRKTVAADAIIGLGVETVLLFPFACGYIIYLQATGAGIFHTKLVPPWLLMLGGVITPIPLMLFAAGARRLRFATIGIVQFLAPTLQFLVALAFGEPFTGEKITSFACIWAAVVIYCIDTVRAHRTTTPREDALEADALAEV